MFNQDFYWSIIRKCVSLFGTLFSEINITRTNTAGQSEYIRVPITYAQKEKMLARVQQANNADRASLSLTLPVMSFEVTDLGYDGERKLTTTGRAAFMNTSTPSSLNYLYNPVPYDIGFSLYVWVKNAEDGTKIIEQILPYFTPDFTVTVILIPDVNLKTEIPIILHKVAQNDPYEGELATNQPIIWQLDFTVKANFYGPKKSAPIILFANTNFRVADPETLIANAVGNTNIAFYTSVYPGLDANGNPTSNAFVTVPANTILSNSNYGYIVVYGEPIGEDILFNADTTAFTADSTHWTADITELPNH